MDRIRKFAVGLKVKRVCSQCTTLLDRIRQYTATDTAPLPLLCHRHLGNFIDTRRDRYESTASDGGFLHNRKVDMSALCEDVSLGVAEYFVVVFFQSEEFFNPRLVEAPEGNEDIPSVSKSKLFP